MNNSHIYCPHTRATTIHDVGSTHNQGFTLLPQPTYDQTSWYFNPPSSYPRNYSERFVQLEEAVKSENFALKLALQKDDEIRHLKSLLYDSSVEITNLKKQLEKMSNQATTEPLSSIDIV